MCFLAIDLGATFIKGARLSPEKGAIENVVRIPFPGFAGGLPAGRREIPRSSIMAAVRSVLDDLLCEAPHIRGLLICGQMHGLILAGRDGSPCTEFISWQDTRSLEPHPDGGTIFEHVRGNLGHDAILELGNELRPGLPVTQLSWFVAQDFLPRGAAPLSLTDYVALSLCNRLHQPVTDATNAAAQGSLRVATRTWHQEALRLLGLDTLAWPEIVQTRTVVGQFSHAGKSFPVYVPIGDQQAALLGADMEENELSLNIATGSQVSALTTRSEAGDWQLRPYVDERWLRTITHLPAGRSLNAIVGLLDQLAADQGTPLRDPWEQISRLTSEAAVSQLEVNLAFFPCAIGDHGSIGQLVEDELKVGPLFRGAFRSMALNYQQAARRVAPGGWDRIVFSGGLVQKLRPLQEEILAALSSPHRVVSHAEDTLAGMLKVAQGLS